MWWFNIHIYCEMITKLKLTNPSLHIVTILCVCARACMYMWWEHLRYILLAKFKCKIQYFMYTFKRYVWMSIIKLTRGRLYSIMLLLTWLSKIWKAKVKQCHNVGWSPRTYVVTGRCRYKCAQGLQVCPYLPLLCALTIFLTVGPRPSNHKGSWYLEAAASHKQLQRLSFHDSALTAGCAWLLRIPGKFRLSH